MKENLIKVNKNDFLKILNLTSSYISISSSDLNLKTSNQKEVDVLREFFLPKDKLENFLQDKENEIEVFKDLKINRDYNKKRSEDFYFFEGRDKLIEHSANKAKKFKNEKWLELNNNLQLFLEKESIENYKKTKKNNINFIPEYFYLNNKLINSFNDLQSLLNIKVVYILDDIIEGRFTEIDVTSSLFNFETSTRFFNNEVIVDLDITINAFGLSHKLNKYNFTENGCIFKSDKIIFSDKKDLKKYVKEKLRMSNDIWNKKLSISSEVLL